MKSAVITLALLLFAAHAALAQPSYRRGNSATTANPRYQFFCVDNDDNAANAPSYHFVDTTYGTWYRVTSFSNNDDGYAYIPKTIDSIAMPFFTVNAWVLQPRIFQGMHDSDSLFTVGGSIGTNGTICLNGSFPSAKNVPLPDSSVSTLLIAPLWTDWELASNTNIYVRCVHPDTFYVSFYNLALKGTNGSVRATFQVQFNAADSTVTFDYKSFTGSYRGVPAAALIQRIATIGMQSTSNEYGITYLSKGYYFARSTGSSLFEKNLHDTLAIKFYRAQRDAFQILSITNPPSDRYELSSASLAPAANIRNLSDTTIRVFVQTTMQSADGATTYYNRYDSIDVQNQTTATFTAPLYQSIPYGESRVRFKISYRNGVSDNTDANNIAYRYFGYMSAMSLPIHEEMDAPSASNWLMAGTSVANSTDVLRTPVAPFTGGAHALVMNRYDVDGMPYPRRPSGDTLLSAPVDLSGKSNVYLMLHFTRGLSTDSTYAGVMSSQFSGPEPGVTGPSNAVYQQPDSLVIEGLRSVGSEWNPADSAWTILATITGGLDYNTQTLNIQLPSALLHNHFRLRLRVLAHDNAQNTNWRDDADNFVIDELHLEQMQSQRSELEPIDVDLAGFYNRIPRDIHPALYPKVRIRNNGNFVPLTLSNLHLIITDGIGRPVYDKVTAFAYPSAHTDSIYVMPFWNLQGTQGGTLTAKVILHETYFDTYRNNDTAIFYKTINIGDEYGLDDGAADTIGSTSSPQATFTYQFTPLGSDTLRGVGFYYTGASNSSSWLLSISDTSGNTISRGWSVSPTGAGFYRGTFTGVPMIAGQPYTLSFRMTSGSNLGGDASNGLVWFTHVDSAHSSNNEATAFRPDILDAFNITPSLVADNGGTLLPMMRLVFSGSQNYLPLVLTNFAADRLSSGAVRLTWKTAEEQDVANYTIERVGNGTIATIPATNAGSYATLDPAPPTTALTYRLSERDRDGTIKDLGSVELAAIPSAFAVYPNPTTGPLLLDGITDANLNVLDATGRCVKHFSSVSGGVDLSDLPPGIYQLAFTQNHQQYLRRIVVLH